MGSQEMLPLQASVFKGGKCPRGPGAVATQTGVSQESTTQPESNSGDPPSLLP